MLTTMVACISRAHSGGKKSWLTYQNEIEMGVELIEKVAKRVTEALLKFEDLESVCKVLFATDSSTAKAMIEGLTDPGSEPAHYTAMARRWVHWSQRMELTIHWNMSMAHCRGNGIISRTGSPTLGISCSRVGRNLRPLRVL